MAITKRSFGAPEMSLPFAHGRSDVVALREGEEVWWSELHAGWNWDEDLEPYAEGATSCPMTHREVVVAGRIRYLTDEGDEVVAGPGDALFIEPGHRAWVVGDETCILVDW